MVQLMFELCLNQLLNITLQQQGRYFQHNLAQLSEFILRCALQFSSMMRFTNVDKPQWRQHIVNCLLFSSPLNRGNTRSIHINISTVYELQKLLRVIKLKKTDFFDEMFSYSKRNNFYSGMVNKIHRYSHKKKFKRNQ